MPGRPIGPSLTEARRRVAVERARSLKLKTDRDRRLLISAADAARDAFEAARVLRDAILAVPPRLAAELAAEVNAATVQARLERELRQALEATARALTDEPADEA
jgi:hypothetical protein